MNDDRVKHPVLLLSGGVDSSVLLAHLVHTGPRPVCLSFDYGQRHARELVAAADVARYYRCPHRMFQLPPAAMRGSSLTGNAAASLTGSSTVIPGRNLVMLSVAVAEAARIGSDSVQFAAHAGDAAVYPDCREEFTARLSAASEVTYGVKVVAPFVHKTKKEIVRLGRDLKVPFHLTWSCYGGGSEPCGVCGACVEREGAMT